MNLKESSVPFNEAIARAALDRADPNVLRLALYQATRDPELAAMQPSKAPFWGGAFNVPVLGEADIQLVKAKALAFLQEGSRDRAPAPNETELRSWMGLLLGEPASEVIYEFSRPALVEDEFPYGVEWTREPSAETKQKFHVVIIGAGLAGLAASIQLTRLGIPHVVIERNAGVGGTWWVNDYPECRVDVASHHYQYSFMKHYPWKHLFATQPELVAYAEEVVERYGLKPNICLETTLTGAKWDDGTKTWQITLRRPDGRNETITTNAIISAAGLFNAPKMPDIPGLDTFKGKMFHTTQWDHSYDYRGKQVGQIGVGSTGAQLMPEIARKASHLTVFQRSPQWVSDIAGYRDPITEEGQWLFDHFPHYWNWYSASTSAILIGDPEGLQNYDREWQKRGGLVSKRNDEMRKYNLNYINAKVGHRPDLVKKVTPSHPPFTKRPVVDNGWFDALNRDNVDLVTEPIERITPNGVKTKDGVEHKIDLLLLCAGFEVQRYLWPVKYQGRGGVTLEQAWSKDGARTYLGITVPDFPNLFTIYGPNSQVRGGGLITWGEIWGRYAIKSIVHLIETGQHAMEIKRDVFDSYNALMDKGLDECIWEAPGQKSYYTNDFGRQAVNMPWKPNEYYAWIREPNLEDYDVS